MEEEIREWHSHNYGPVGVFMFDLRGNRINGAGEQASDNSLLSDDQWADFEAFMAREDLKVLKRGRIKLDKNWFIMF